MKKIIALSSLLTVTSALTLPYTIPLQQKQKEFLCVQEFKEIAHVFVPANVKELVLSMPLPIVFNAAYDDLLAGKLTVEKEDMMELIAATFEALLHKEASFKRAHFQSKLNLLRAYQETIDNGDAHLQIISPKMYNQCNQISCPLLTQCTLTAGNLIVDPYKYCPHKKINPDIPEIYENYDTPTTITRAEPIGAAVLVQFSSGPLTTPLTPATLSVVVGFGGYSTLTGAVDPLTTIQTSGLAFITPSNGGVVSDFFYSVDANMVASTTLTFTFVVLKSAANIGTTNTYATIGLPSSTAAFTAAGAGLNTTFGSSAITGTNTAVAVNAGDRLVIQVTSSGTIGSGLNINLLSFNCGFYFTPS